MTSLGFAPIRSFPKSIPVYGYIYDVKSGRLNEIEGAKAIGAAGFDNSSRRPRKRDSQWGGKKFGFRDF